MLGVLAASNAWQDAGALFVRTLTAFIGTPFRAAPARRRPRSVFVGHIELTCAEMEIALALLIGHESMKGLSASVLGTDDLEDATSLVLETGNVLMGALKTSLAADGLHLALGLPRQAAYAGRLRALRRASLRTRVLVASPAAQMDLWISASAPALKSGLADPFFVA